MQRILKTNAFALLVVCVLVFALFVAMPVRAEAEVPTSDPAPVEVSAPPADTQPADPVVEPQAPTEAADEAPAELATETQPADGVAELPAALVENDVQLVTAEEEALPLASEAVVEAVKAADPYFFVGTTRYSFTKTDCDPGTPGDQACSNPIQAALDYIRDRGLVPTNRMIYVEDDSYNEDVSLDGTTSSSLSQIKGLLGQSMTGTVLNGNLSVIGTTAGFTLSNFTVNGRIVFDANKGTLVITDVTQQGAVGTGIGVSNHNGAVTLTRVSATNNTQTGADIYNAVSTGNVTISESVFDHNGSGAVDNDMFSGLFVNTHGAVTLNGISASGNNGDGAVMWHFKSLNVRNSLFNDNKREPDLTHSGYGLDVWTQEAASVSLDTVTANNNGYDGFRLTTYGNVTVKNLIAEVNGYNGLRICGITNYNNDCYEARAVNVSISNATVTGNGETGIGIAARGTVTLNGAFSGWNGVDGYFIESVGNVTLNGVSAEGNPNGYGAFISTADLEGAKGSVTLLNKLGSNRFNNNLVGLEIRSKGAISLTGVSASGSDHYGARLDNTSGTAGVTINNVYFGDNHWFGGEIFSNGAVVYQNANASNNGQDLSDMLEDPRGGGLYIYNYSAVKPAVVTVSNSWFFNNQGGDGLFVDSKGNISLVDVGAGNNSGSGAHLINTGTGTNVGTGNILVKASLSTDWRDMSGNKEWGLYAVSNGTITVQNMVFNENNYDGAYLDNFGGLKKAVIVTDVGMYNNQNGLYIISKGAVTVTNIGSTNNRETGVFIQNWDGAGAVKINRTLKENDNYISDNGGSGLEIHANGAVTLLKVITNNNGWDSGNVGGGYGTLIDNCNDDGNHTCRLAGGSVSISAPSGWMSEFSNNAWTGLMVFSPGAITLVNVRANDNGWNSGYSDGILLYNRFTGLSNGITIKFAGNTWNEANHNNGSGLEAVTNGVISIMNINANNNRGNGAYLWNENSASPKAVTITNGWFNDNTNGDGLAVDTSGVVKISNVGADRNDMSEGWLNVNSGHVEGVQEQIKNYDNAGSMADYWRFTAQEDGEIEFWLQSNDLTPVLRLYVWNSGSSEWDEVAVDSDESDVNGIASFFYTLVNGNDYRVEVSSPAMDQSGVYVLGINGENPDTNNANGANGLQLFNYGSGAVTVSNLPNRGSFNENSSTGMYIDGLGAVTLSNIHAERNQQGGLMVTTVGAVTVGGWANSFNDNRSDGLNIYSRSTISLSNMDVYNNGGNGAMLYNHKGTADVKILTTRSNWWNGFGNNGGDGLQIVTRGNVVINNLDASNNGGGGVFINSSDEFGALVLKSVKITNGHFMNNQSNDGLYISFYGAVILDVVDASQNQSSEDNYGNGIWINNTVNNAVQNVTVTRSNFNDNHWMGLGIISNGNVILDGLFAMNNGQEGLYVNNQGANGTGTVTLTNKKGANNFINNGWYGVNILSNKAITVSGVEVKYNGIGMSLVSSGGPVSLSNALVHDNRGPGGIYVETHGFDATLNNVQSYMNGLGYHGSGLTAVVSGANLRLINSSFHGNGQYGVDADLDSPARLILSGTMCFANGRDDGAPNYNVY